MISLLERWSFGTLVLKVVTDSEEKIVSPVSVPGVDKIQHKEAEGKAMHIYITEGAVGAVHL